MSEDLPFGDRMAAWPSATPFPLDGEYTFKIRLQRNTVGGTIRGIDDEHEIEVRIDRALVQAVHDRRPVQGRRCRHSDRDSRRRCREARSCTPIV